MVNTNTENSTMATLYTLITYYLTSNKRKEERKINDIMSLLDWVSQLQHLYSFLLTLLQTVIYVKWNYPARSKDWSLVHEWDSSRRLRRRCLPPPNNLEHTQIFLLTHKNATLQFIHFILHIYTKQDTASKTTI